MKESIILCSMVLNNSDLQNFTDGFVLNTCLLTSTMQDLLLQTFCPTMEWLSDFTAQIVWGKLFQNILVTLGLLVVIGLLRFAYLVSQCGKDTPSMKYSQPNRTLSCKTMVVLGSGGHTSEMISLLGGMDINNYTPRTYVVASGDSMSIDKITKFEKKVNKDSKVDLRMVPRARQVKQSYVTSVFTTLCAVLYSLPIVFKTRPELILCNGPGTCIPICFWAYLLKFVWIKDVKIVYVESICRVERLSLSGLMLYYSYAADYVLVQWLELQKLYPRTRYLGRIV